MSGLYQESGEASPDGLTDCYAPMLFCRRCGATTDRLDHDGEPCPKEWCGGEFETLAHWMGDDDG